MLAAKGTNSISTSAHLLMGALKEGTHFFYKLTDGKKRKIYKSSGVKHKQLDKNISATLRTVVNYPDRIFQSKKDLSLLQDKKYRFFVSMDLKDALNKNNLFMILLVCFCFNPLLILRILIPVLVLYRRNSMMVGLSTSQLLMALCFKNAKKIEFGKIDSQVYVDDLRISSKKKYEAHMNIIIYKMFFSLMGFRWHKGPKYCFVDLNNKQKFMFARLGLVYGYRKNGQAYCKIRSSTINKYKRRILKVLKCTDKTKVEKITAIERIVYKGRYSLMRAFPSEIRNGDAQIIQFNSWLRRKKHYYLER